MSSEWDGYSINTEWEGNIATGEKFNWKADLRVTTWCRRMHCCSFLICRVLSGFLSEFVLNCRLRSSLSFSASVSLQHLSHCVSSVLFFFFFLFVFVFAVAYRWSSKSVNRWWKMRHLRTKPMKPKLSHFDSGKPKKKKKLKKNGKMYIYLFTKSIRVVN